MYTTEQIRAAGIAGEISSINVERLIKILKKEKKVSSKKDKELDEFIEICSRCGKEFYDILGFCTCNECKTLTIKK